MVFSPAVFSATVQNGFQKPSRYRLRFPIPSVLAGVQTFTQDLPYMEYYSDSIDFVDVGFATRNVVRYGYGPHEKQPTFPVFNDVMVTFYNDSLSNNLTFFQQWMWSVQNFNMSSGILPNSGDTNGSVQPYELLYRDDYVVNGMITLLDNTDQDVCTWRMRRMWPIHMPNVKLGWAIINDVMRVTVMFAYTDWYVDTSLPGTLITQNQGISNQGQQSQATQTYTGSFWNNNIGVPSGVPMPVQSGQVTTPTLSDGGFPG
jgi:hypothetical protein